MSRLKNYRVYIGIIIAFVMVGIAAGTVRHVREAKYEEVKDESSKEEPAETSAEEPTEGGGRESAPKTEPGYQETMDIPGSPAGESTAAPEQGQTEESESAPKQPGTAGEMAGFRRVGYFTSWSAYAKELSLHDVDGSLLTHLNFAFANLGRDGAIQVGDPKADTQMTLGGRPGGHFGQIPAFKAKYPEVKLLLSVGGWSWSGNFSEVAASEDKRVRFAQSAVELMTKYGFDGLDVDWEYPVSGGDNIPHRAEDGDNYIELLRTVRSAFDALEQTGGKRYLLSIAGGAGSSFVKNNRMKDMMGCLDYINLMTYDYHGPWESRTGHNAPLYASDGFSVSDTVKGYLAAGAFPEKLNLGLAFYGRGWALASSPAPAFESESGLGTGDTGGLGQVGSPLTGSGYGFGTWNAGVFTSQDLAENYVDKNGYVRYFDQEARVPYLSNGSSFITFDDGDSILEKMDYAARMRLGGVMFWEFGGDRDKRLQQLIYQHRFR